VSDFGREPAGPGVDDQFLQVEQTTWITGANPLLARAQIRAKEVIDIETTMVDVNPEVAPIPVPAWAWALVLAAVLGVYLMAMANATVLRQGATVLHEFFHDGRHFLSFPCH